LRGSPPTHSSHSGITWLRFRYGGAFGVSDPLHGIDVGFYVFQLPSYQMLQTSVMLLTALAIGGVGIV